MRALYIVEPNPPPGGSKHGKEADVMGEAAVVRLAPGWSGERGCPAMIEIVMVERADAIRHVYSGDNG